MLGSHESAMQKLGEVYRLAKPLILYVEEIDPSAKSNIQIIKELRDAFDHLMRPWIEENSLGDAYFQAHVDKAIGHVYRAAFDAMDGTAISLRQNISTTLKPYPLDIVLKAIPNYSHYHRILHTTPEQITALRNAKDIEKDLAPLMEQYIVIINTLKEIYATVDGALVLMQELLTQQQQENEHAKKHNSKLMWLSVFLSGVFGTLLGWLITKL